MAKFNRRQFLTFSISTVLSRNLQANSALSKTGLVIDERFSKHIISVSHPESPARYHAITQHLLADDLHKRVTLIKPKIDIEQWLAKIHSTDHINAIKSNQPDTHKHAVLATSGVLAAIDAVCTNKVENAFCASRPPGHHATNTGQEEGFCYYNHIAIAARYAQQQYHLKKILIIDWDYHHGNGTQWAFYSDPSVLFFSTHDMFAYPGTGTPKSVGEGDGKGFNINVHLDCGASDSDIMTAFREKLLPAADDFAPDLILISAGFDSREDDLLGCHKITNQGFKQLTDIVKSLAAHHCDGKIVSSAVITHINALMA